MDNSKQPVPTDVIAEWLRLTREVVSRYYPEAKYASLVIVNGGDNPDAILPVIAKR